MINRKLVTAIALAGSVFAAPAFANLDQETATVSMNVGLFAALTGLDDFVLTTTDPDGSAGAVYNGSDSFNLESNGQVRVALSGGNLKSAANTEVATTYALDSAGITFDTTSNAVHNAAHSVSAQATLGAISAQEAGGYSSVITLTVSAI